MAKVKDGIARAAVSIARGTALFRLLAFSEDFDARE